MSRSSQDKIVSATHNRLGDDHVILFLFRTALRRKTFKVAYSSSKSDF